MVLKKIPRKTFPLSQKPSKIVYYLLINETVPSNAIRHNAPATQRPGTEKNRVFPQCNSLQVPSVFPLCFTLSQAFTVLYFISLAIIVIVTSSNISNVISIIVATVTVLYLFPIGYFPYPPAANPAVFRR